MIQPLTDARLNAMHAMAAAFSDEPDGAVYRDICQLVTEVKRLRAALKQAFSLTDDTYHFGGTL